MIAPRLLFDIAIATKISAGELLTARALGYEWREAYQSSVDVIDDMFDISRLPCRPTVTGRFRP